MLPKSIVLSISIANAWRLSTSEPRNDLPDSAAVIDALKNPDLYEMLSRQYDRDHDNNQGQSPLGNIFDDFNRKDPSCGPRAACPAYDGEVREINGRRYNIYCTNAPWGIYFWLPKADSLNECERKCHDHQYDCNGLTYYPSTGACSIIHSKNAAPYIWDNGYQKIGAIPVKSDVAFAPGMICPLPGSDNQVYDFDEDKDNKMQFKVSCRNQFNVPAGARKQTGIAKNVDECGQRCGKDKDCYGFQYYQPTFPGGRVDGARNCELITDKIGNNDWVPLHRPNQYLSGLRVEHSDCGDIGWNNDENGKKNEHGHGDDNRHCREQDEKGDCLERGRPHRRPRPGQLDELDTQSDL